MRIREYLTEEITDGQLRDLERYADKLFASLGLDVEFTRHFRERVNDVRNRGPITLEELARLFRESYRKYGKRISNMSPKSEAVLNDMATNINLPFVIQWDRSAGGLDLVAKTIMRKKGFMSRNPKLSFA